MSSSVVEELLARWQFENNKKPVLINAVGDKRTLDESREAADAAESEAERMQRQNRLYRELDQFKSEHAHPFMRLSTVLFDYAAHTLGKDDDTAVDVDERTYHFLKLLQMTAGDSDGRWQSLLKHIQDVQLPGPVIPTLVIRTFERANLDAEMKVLEDEIARNLVAGMRSEQNDYMEPPAFQEDDLFGTDDDEEEEEEVEEQPDAPNEDVGAEGPGIEDDGQEEEDAEEDGGDTDSDSNTVADDIDDPDVENFKSHSDLIEDVVGVLRRTFALVGPGVDTDATSDERQAVRSLCNLMLASWDHNTFAHSYDWQTGGDEGGQLQRPSRNYYYRNVQNADVPPAGRHDDLAAAFRRLCVMCADITLAARPNNSNDGPPLPTTFSHIEGVVRKVHDILLNAESVGKYTDTDDAHREVMSLFQRTAPVSSEVQDIVEHLWPIQDAHIERWLDPYSPLDVSIPPRQDLQGLNRKVVLARSIPSLLLFVNACAQLCEFSTRLLLARGCLGHLTDRFEYPSSVNVFEQEQEAAAAADDEQ